MGSLTSPLGLCMPGARRPFDMNTHSGSGSDDEPALRMPTEIDELAEEDRPVTHYPEKLRDDWPEEGEQHEDESVAQILAGVSSSRANPNVQGRWLDADRSVSPPFLRIGAHLNRPPNLCHSTRPPCAFAAGVLRRFRGDRRV